MIAPNKVVKKACPSVTNTYKWYGQVKEAIADLAATKHCKPLEDQIS